MLKKQSILFWFLLTSPDHTGIFHVDKINLFTAYFASPCTPRHCPTGCHKTTLQKAWFNSLMEKSFQIVPSLIPLETINC